MNPSARPMSIWTRPLLVGLLAIALLATASVAIAAPAGTHAPAAAQNIPPVDAAAPLVSVLPASVVGPTETTPTVVLPQLPDPRAQVAAQAKSIAVPSTPKVTPKTAKPKPVVKRVSSGYHGVYHLWIPGLGLSRGISDWGCNGGLIPNRVEYWGCAGKNNLYLLGHAWGVFAPIHDGYHSGALHVGLTAYYADKGGTVRKYRISQIRHVANKDYATWSQWAMASSSSQIITLQTCDGSTSGYRILVRLVRA